MLNAEAIGFTKGMADPEDSYVTPDSPVKGKFLETEYTDRGTANGLILKLFPTLVEGKGRQGPAPYVNLTLFESDEAVAPGSRFTVAADIALPPVTHLYAPRVKATSRFKR